VVTLLMPGRRILGAMTTALNLMSELDENEDPLKRKVAVELGLLALLASMFLLALLAGPIVAAGIAAADLAPGPGDPAVVALRLAVTAAVVWSLLFIIYLVVPRGHRYRRAAAAGATVATILFFVARGGVQIALDLLGDTVTAVYGPISIAVLLMVWGWYASLVLLVGGSFASHVKTLRIDVGAGTPSRHDPDRRPGTIR